MATPGEAEQAAFLVAHDSLFVERGGGRGRRTDKGGGAGGENRPGRQCSACQPAVPGRPGSLRPYGVPTHSSRPSANTWCFHTGTFAFSRSIRAREAS